MRRIQNTKNGRIALITDEYKKGNVVVNYELTYEDDGTTTNLSTSTVRRWWKDIEPKEEDEASKYVQASQAITKELNKNNKKSLAEMVEQQANQDAVAVAVELKATPKKEKAQKKPVKKPTNTESNVPEILEYIDKLATQAGMNYYVREKQPNHRNYKPESGKVLFTVHVGKASVEMYFKAFQLPDKVQPQLEVLNGFFNRRLVVSELTDNIKSVINTIIKNFKEEK